MSEPFIGQITMFGGNFAPINYAFCNGQILPINQYTALFSLIGTTYGGNGTTNFALPNLQSRLSNHMGQGPGLASYTIGQSGGSPQVTLTSQTMPAHTHMLLATTGPASTGAVGPGVVPAASNGPVSPAQFYADVESGEPPITRQQMNPAACGPAGGNQPHDNLMPSQCVTFVIALQGIFPSRT